MIEENGRVVAKEEGKAWVETVRVTACGSCSARTGCGHSVLEKWMSKDANHVLAADDLNVKVGDEVVIGVPEDVVLKGSLIVYLLPMLTLVGGATIGHLSAVQLVMDTDLLAGLGALLGFLAGMGIVRWHANWSKGDRRFQPVILRRLAASGSQFVELHCHQE